MSATYTIDQKTGRTLFYVSYPSASTGTFHAGHITLDATAAVAEANSIIRDAHKRYLHMLGLPEIGDDYTDEEELEWNTFFAQPHVQAELERLAEEAERQFAAGETEEGGFAVE